VSETNYYSLKQVNNNLIMKKETIFTCGYSVKTT
jgi:hypothetical protein